MKKILELITDTNKNTSEEVTKTNTEIPKENDEAVTNLNNNFIIFE